MKMWYNIIKKIKNQEKGIITVYNCNAILNMKKFEGRSI